ncbi:Peroxisomal membrane protein 2 [Trichoplax sp. H2]|nr:Peroxisomal membrane protein 2 [Trichoplax sp. H2]|eukprot:RDD41006.1 Peroxisomal membrane protein 2 [Trichoplax sp. H2]
MSEKGKQNILHRLLDRYFYLLQHYPLATKSITSAILAGLGDFISQKLAQGGQGTIVWRNVGAYAFFNLIVTGPLSHFYYQWLEKLVPSKVPFAPAVRVLVDRLIFAPPFLFLVFYLVALFQGHSSEVAMDRIRKSYWISLKMNWRVWTVFQYIIVNYVPTHYRVLCGNLVGLGWNIYLSSKQTS